VISENEKSIYHKYEQDFEEGYEEFQLDEKRLSRHSCIYNLTGFVPGTPPATIFASVEMLNCSQTSFHSSDPFPSTDPMQKPTHFWDIFGSFSNQSLKNSWTVTEMIHG